MLKQFILDGGYQNNCTGENEKQFYRFTNPTKKEYPHMLEIFARRAHDIIDLEQITPIKLDDKTVSLSAIILDDEYYRVLKVIGHKLMGFL